MHEAGPFEFIIHCEQLHAATSVSDCNCIDVRSNCPAEQCISASGLLSKI
jgi:hypothetical protein